MSNVSIWLENSLLLRMFSLVLRPEVFQESCFYKLLKSMSNAICSCFRGSILGLFFSDYQWEGGAVDDSRLVLCIRKLTFPLDNLLDFLNRCIKSSFPHKTIMALLNKTIELPFVTLSYGLLPAIMINTVVKTVLRGTSLKSFTFRLVIMLLLYAMSYIRLSLGDILCSSIVWQILNWISGGRVNIPCKNSNYKSFHTHEKLSIIIPSMIFGLMYFFFPKTTLVKLIGIIYLSTYVYIRPEAGIALAVFLLPLTETLYTAGIIGLTFVSLILNRDRYELDIPTAFIPATFFVTTAVLATAFSLMRMESLKTLPLYFAYFMLYYVTSTMFKDSKILKKTITYQLISVVLLSLYGIYQYFFIKMPTAIAWVDVNQFPELSTRVYATLENPNVLAEYLGLLIPLVLGLLWVSKGFRQKTALLVILALMALCMIFTFSRGAWVGLALSILIFATLKEPRLFILILIAVIVAPAFLPPVIINRIASIGSLEDTSNAFRVSILIAVIRMIKDYWLTGLGLGLSAFSRVYRDYMLAGTPAIHSHNLYLQIGLEMGIMGLIAMLWVVGRGFSVALGKIKGTQWTSFLQAGIVSALAGHLLHGLFDYVWFSPRIVMTFWLLFGMMSALSSVQAAKQGTGE